MNRVNFARISGVILDVCKMHGVWFDRDELSQVLESIQGGGLSRAANIESETTREAERPKIMATLPPDCGLLVGPGEVADLILFATELLRGLG